MLFSVCVQKRIFFVWLCCHLPGVLLLCHLHYYLFLMHFIVFSLHLSFICRILSILFFPEQLVVMVARYHWMCVSFAAIRFVVVCIVCVCTFFLHLLHIIGLFSFWFRLNDFNARWRYVWFTVFAIDVKCNNNLEPMKYFKCEYTYLTHTKRKNTIYALNKVWKDCKESERHIWRLRNKEKESVRESRNGKCSNTINNRWIHRI